MNDRISVDKILYNGELYSVGQIVVVNEFSELVGMVGTIAEIRVESGAESSMPSIYCDFVRPIFSEEITGACKLYKLAKGEEKQLDTFSFERVPMSPCSLTPLDSKMKPEEERVSVYVLTEDWGVDDETGAETYLFLDKDAARKEMRLRAYLEKLNGTMDNWQDDNDFVEDVDENSYSAYIDGFYNDNHYSLTITIKYLPLSILPTRLLKKLKK